MAVVSRSTDLDSVPYDEPRQASIVAIRSDGQERLITTLRIAPRDPKVELRLSGTGWLAADVGEGLRLIDLRDPSHVVGPLDGRGYRSWIPGGRFAEWTESGSMRLTDPETGATTMLSLPSLARVFDELAALQEGPVEPIDGWLADGTGFVTGVDHSRWRVVYLDGRPDGQVIPRLDPSLSKGRGPAGMSLQVCDPSLDGTCPGLPSGAVVGKAADGTLTTWYRDELAPDEVVAARHTRDGTAMWLLLDRREGGRQFALARVGAGGTAREVLSAGLPSSEPDTYWWIEDVAPDESLVALGGLGDLVLAEPLTGRVRAVEGDLLGLVPDADVDAWAGGPYGEASPGVSLTPRFPAWPTLRPLSELIAERVPSEGTVLWRWEQSATDGPATPASPVVSEPMALDGGFGVMLACSGPSDVVITMDPPPWPDIEPVASACRDGDSAATGSEFAGPDLDQAVRFTVESAPDTSWQVVVFDSGTP